MANSIFKFMQPSAPAPATSTAPAALDPSNPAVARFQGMLQMLKGQDPNQVSSKLAAINPQFAAFMRENQGKSMEELASKYGVDISSIMRMFG